MRTVYINLYRQGWYHRQGKAGTLPFHAGDTYPTEEAALADIDPEAPYIATVPLELGAAVGAGALSPSDFHPYPAWGHPVPLSTTRAIFRSGVPSHIAGLRPLVGDEGSLETAEFEARPHPVLDEKLAHWAAARGIE